MADIGDTYTSPFPQVQLDQRVITAGTTPLPLSFATDTDTGLFRPAANTVAIVTGGTEAVRLTSGQLLQFTSTASNEANGTGLNAFTTSVGPASASTSIVGWIRFLDKDGAARFLPYW